MKSFIEETLYNVLAGKAVNKETVLKLAQDPNQEQFYKAADSLRTHYQGDFLSLCSIINARCGQCSEDCKFCAQSVHYPTQIAEYKLIEQEEALDIARNNNAHGVRRLSLVTSGRTVTMDMIERLGKIYGAIEQETSFILCGSMGLLNQEKAFKLKGLGIERYHCNLETSRNFFKQICSTHTYQDKVDTLQYAKNAGMTTCSGGIIGMGETLEDRIDFAFELLELGVDSIPLNILTPIANTPLGELSPLSTAEVLTCIACFRFVLPNKVIRIAGGRQQLGKDQYRCFQAGANGAMVGNYLTTEGNSLEQDIKNIKNLGYQFDKPLTS